MIAVDTSSLIAYLADDPGQDVELLDRALGDGIVVFPPVVTTELLSDPILSDEVVKLLSNIPMLDITDGYWTRAGQTRAKLLRKTRKARLADTLIAQACIDHQVPLITRDQDFLAFQKYAGLILLDA